MHPLFQDILSLVKEILFPVACFNCKRPGEFLCDECGSSLGRVVKQRCIICQRPAALGLTHPACRQRDTPSQLMSMFDYHNPSVANAVIAGKYKLLPDIFRLLGKQMGTMAAAQALKDLWAGSVITFVPLARRRQRWRGFNQSELLAREVALKLKLPIEAVLIRTRMAKPQKELTRAQRQRNLKNSFVCRSKTKVQESKFLLIDDVTTTGTTLLEATKVLKSAGAASVSCLTLAQD